MDNEKECIFCFENLHDDLKICESFYENIYVYQDDIINSFNKTLTLNCKHTFHMSCFIKYITIKYKNIKYKNKKYNETINCPFCRHFINNNELKHICIINIKRLEKIKQDMYTKIIKYKTKISFDKIKLYSRKLLNFANLPHDVFQYHKSLDNYEELTFLYEKIKYLTRETYFIYEKIINELES